MQLAWPFCGIMKITEQGNTAAENEPKTPAARFVGESKTMVIFLPSSASLPEMILGTGGGILRFVTLTTADTFWYLSPPMAVAITKTQPARLLLTKKLPEKLVEAKSKGKTDGNAVDVAADSINLYGGSQLHEVTETSTCSGQLGTESRLTTYGNSCRPLPKMYLGIEVGAKSNDKCLQQRVTKGVLVASAVASGIMLFLKSVE
jgi:hypothetical protein